MSNRIIKYMESEPPRVHNVVISDSLTNRVIFTFGGNKLVWQWDNDGIYCPGSTVGIKIHPLAAEALVEEEVMSLVRMEGIGADNIIYIDHRGEKVNGISMTPPSLDDSWDVNLKKTKIKELYERFVAEKDTLSEEMIGEAISFGVLSPFLSLVNLNL